VGVDVVKVCMASLPIFLLIVVAAFGPARGRITLIGLLIPCLSATVGLYAPWVPLIADELTNAQIVSTGRARIAQQKSQRPSRQEAIVAVTESGTKCKIAMRTEDTTVAG
jgi:hypothetical protein